MNQYLRIPKSRPIFLILPLDSSLLQSLESLTSAVIELSSLSNRQSTTANNQDLFDTDGVLCRTALQHTRLNVCGSTGRIGSDAAGVQSKRGLGEESHKFAAVLTSLSCRFSNQAFRSRGAGSESSCVGNRSSPALAEQCRGASCGAERQSHCAGGR